jgi:protein SCO1/2
MMYSTSSGSGSNNNNSPVGWKSLLLLVLTGSGVLFFFENEKKRRMKSIAENQKGVGKAAVGGPFELINAATNKKFTDKDLLGNFCLIYFGFTTCPDICPDELEKMSEVIDIVEKETEKKR